MPAPTSATRHYRRLQRLQALTVAAMRRSWRRMRVDGSWEQQYADQIGPQVVGIATAAQVAVTNETDAYVADVLNELDFGPRTQPGVLPPQGFAGYAGDGRAVADVLGGTVARARALSQTRERERALADAESYMDTIAQTLLADAMRAAEEVAMAARPWVAGYVRMVSPPCCSRCALLSGRFYPFSEGFLRHPNCDCYHVPAPDDPAKVRELVSINSPERYFESLSEAEQDRVFTRAGAEAIRAGADIGRVVNARSGMSKAQDTGRLQRVRIGGRDVFTTTTGTASRGRLPGQRRGVRLMPESIFEIAGDNREEALRLLRLNGYLL